jgi:hypothetical protein
MKKRKAGKKVGKTRAKRQRPKKAGRKKGAVLKSRARRLSRGGPPDTSVLA